MKVAVILPAAGLGTRMGRTAEKSAERVGTSRKQFMLLEGLPIFLHTVRKFAACETVSEIVVSVRREDLDWAREMVAQAALAKPVHVVEGGDSRQDSVENALAVVDPATDLVAVHDAVRPFIDLETIQKVIAEASESGAAIVGIVPVDTVKQVGRPHTNRAKIRATIPRERLVLAQTPQVFRYELLRRAFEQARADGFTGTDESSLVERIDDVEVSVVLGSDRNIKITKPTDMELARLYSQSERAAQEQR
ncbi:MAG: 2-C-methyl-D-erythritol 4-phosphate cytidylyltransferase [Bryobacteraceae bacterium]